MSVEYIFSNYRSSHYDAFLNSLPEIDGNNDMEIIDSINISLLEFNGKIISVSGWRGSAGILGLEFATEADLLYFKLKFN
jgi:hypothetical protein